MHTCIYTRGTGQSGIILGMHVDDQTIIGPSKVIVIEKRDLKRN